MSTHDFRTFPTDSEEVVPPLSTAEIGQLRRLLAVARYDERQRAFVIDTGHARLVLREDGTVRCEGAEVVLTADHTITLNGAAIELN